MYSIDIELVLLWADCAGLRYRVCSFPLPSGVSPGEAALSAAVI